MSKISIVLIIIAILVAVGLVIYYGYYDNKEDESNGNNNQTEEQVDLSKLFDGMQETVQTDLVEGGDEELKWAVEEEEGLNEVSIKLNTLKANSISIREGEDIKTYLTDQEFDPISINLPLKKYAEISGYKKGNVVCLVLSGPTGYKEAPDDWTPPNPDLRDIDIRCGEMHSQSVAEVTCTAVSGGSMTLTEAKNLAKNSDCGEDFAKNHICNSQTGTWWLGMNIERENCNPSCEINIKTKKAALNMRCVNTGTEE